MKKTIAISFLFIFLCANTEIGQLLKLPTLVCHYMEHREHDGEHSISFVNFVKSHYSYNKQHPDTDQHDNHQNLPFKTIKASVNTVLAFENQTEVSFPKQNIIFVNSTVPFYQEFYISNVFASIWQPPKLS